MSSIPAEPPPAPPTAGGVLRVAAPRLLRDSLGPLAGFYLGWKLVGLAAGVLLALAAGLALALLARREGRPGAIVKLVLALVLFRACVGLIGDSTKLYLAMDSVLDVALGAAFLGSLVARRPLAMLFAADVYEFEPETRVSPVFAEVFARITLVFGVTFLVRAAIRLAVLFTGSVDRYVVVAAILDAPVLLALLAWSVSYSVRTFRRTPERAEQFGSA